MRPILQIAGVMDQPEAELLCAAGANYLGFPLRLPDGREDLSEGDAKAVIQSIRGKVSTILITYLARADELVEFCDSLGVAGVQLHGPIAGTELAKLRHKRPELFIIKSLIVASDNMAELQSLVVELHPHVDAFITDTFDPATGRSGATGKTHDWEISRRLVESSPQPVILAGGLDPSNVRAAILQAKPAGVDVHSGVEGAGGRKDLAKVERFVAEAKAAFALIDQQPA